MSVRWRSCAQNGSAPITSRQPGRKIATSAIRLAPTPPAAPPRNAAKVNSGPGTACAAP
jgi:hypothetical protein